MEQARNQLAKEVNIIDIVQSRRLIEQALNLLLSKEKYHELKKDTQYSFIGPDIHADESKQPIEQ